jgi:hypothetical protein
VSGSAAVQRAPARLWHASQTRRDTGHVSGGSTEGTSWRGGTTAGRATLGGQKNNKSGKAASKAVDQKGRAEPAAAAVSAAAAVAEDEDEDEVSHPSEAPPVPLAQIP